MVPLIRRKSPGLESPYRKHHLSTSRLVRYIAVSLVVFTLFATWLLSDVALGEASKFIAFELVYTLLPGCLLYLLLSPVPGKWLRVLAIGWPCGYAMEVGWFALTAALHIRAAFALLPLIAVVTMGPFLYGRGRRFIKERSSRSVGHRGATSSHEGRALDALLVAGAIVLALVLLAFTFFSPAPLPAHAHSVVYSTDNVFDISLAAEARHHWPITEPWVAGQPLHYYTGVFIHVAAVNQVTGVALSTIFLRLFPCVMFLVTALQLWSLGGSIGRSRWNGPVAVFLLLAVEDFNLDPTHADIFHINPFNQFSLSPSFAFGVPFFLGLLELVQARLLGRDTVDRQTRQFPSGHSSEGSGRALILVALLVLGCGTAKTFAAADFIGGLGLFWLWCAVTAKATRRLSYCIIVTAICIGVVYFGMLAGGMASTLNIHPGDFLTHGGTMARAKILLQPVIGSSKIWILLMAAGVPVIAVCLFAPLLGAVWLPLRSGRTVSPPVVLYFSMFLTGLIAYIVLGAPGGVEGVFLVYGYIAMIPVAAMGLVELWSSIPKNARHKLAGACGAVFALGLAMAISAQALTLTGRARYGWYLLAYGLVAGGIVFMVFRHSRLLMPAVSSWLGRIVACNILLLGVSGLVKPVALVAAGAWKTVLHKRISVGDSPASYGMTASLYHGLLWVRAHTSDCDVLAVNNHFTTAQNTSSVYFYYSAFTERRIFLESWFYTPNGTRLAQPFPERFKLNTEAISLGTPVALRMLNEQGVSYVLIDKTHGGGAPEPTSVSRLVFSSRALDVYSLSLQRGATDARQGCRG
jgi:hypothetical protein